LKAKIYLYINIFLRKRFFNFWWNYQII